MTSPNCYYLVQSGTTSSSENCILFADLRSAYDELWEGKLPSESEWEQTAKFSEIVPTNKLMQTLERVCDKNTAVFFDSGSDNVLYKFLQMKASSVRELNQFVSSCVWYILF